MELALALLGGWMSWFVCDKTRHGAVEGNLQTLCLNTQNKPHGTSDLKVPQYKTQRTAIGWLGWGGIYLTTGLI